MLDRKHTFLVAAVKNKTDQHWAYINYFGPFARRKAILEVRIEATKTDKNKTI